jgi:hypothetical protein
MNYGNVPFTYQYAGTYYINPPTGATYMSVLVQGAGGGGGGGWGSGGLQGGGGYGSGGGGGSVIIVRDIAVNVNQTFIVDVGAGGSGGSGGLNGAPGGFSRIYFPGNWQIYARGGGGGYFNNYAQDPVGGGSPIQDYFYSNAPGTYSYAFAGQTGGNSGYDTYVNYEFGTFITGLNPGVAGPVGPNVTVFYGTARDGTYSVTSGSGGGGGDYRGAGSRGIGEGGSGYGGGGGGADTAQAGSSGADGRVTLAFHFGGSISLYDICYVFAVNPTGGNARMNNFYAGGNIVPAYTVGYPNDVATYIPAVGTISFNNFFGLFRVFEYNHTVESGQYFVDEIIYNRAREAGWNGFSPLKATINVWGVLGSSSRNSPALSTVNLPYGTPINITVYAGGFITGCGGGSNSSLGQGGDAMVLTTPVTLKNNGIIQAGGGASVGFAGGAGYYAGAAGYDGSTAGTLESGGHGFPATSGKKKNQESGGNGGGWVANGDSGNTDGWGEGRSSRFHQGYPPGRSIVNVGYLIGGSIAGTLRGATV